MPLLMMLSFLLRQVIAITGASDGIGEALARSYARPGVTLYLTGRRPQALDAAVTACKTLGATAHGKLIDVTDKEGMKLWLQDIDAVTPVGGFGHVLCLITVIMMHACYHGDHLSD